MSQNSLLKRLHRWTNNVPCEPASVHGRRKRRRRRGTATGCVCMSVRACMTSSTVTVNLPKRYNVINGELHTVVVFFFFLPLPVRTIFDDTDLISKVTMTLNRWNCAKAYSSLPNEETGHLLFTGLDARNESLRTLTESWDMLLQWTRRSNRKQTETVTDLSDEFGKMCCIPKRSQLFCTSQACPVLM